MIEKIKEIVEQNPEKIAYQVNDDFILYKDLWRQANTYAQLLKRQGDKPVVIYGNKEVHVILSILACILANRPYVPVGTCMPISRLKQIVDITGASLILSDKILEIQDVECVSIEELKKYKDQEEFIINNDIVYIIFTSGSTGIPKGVPISKNNLNNFIEWISNLMPLREYRNINVLNQASFSFDLSVADLFYSLCNGHTLYAFDQDIQENYEEIFQVFQNIDVAMMTPTFMKLCLINEDFNQINYPNFKCVYFCGELLEKKLVYKIFSSFPKLKIINAYGPTEATSAVSAILITPEMLESEELLPCGDTKNFATEILIDHDEILLKGKSVFNGYLGDLVGGFFLEEGVSCYRTGDIGFIQDNKLYCKGRSDRQVKYKGYRIELDDIEKNINLISGISECAVIAKYNDEGVVKTIKAFVVVEKDVSLSSLKKELSQMIPEYMMPKSFQIVDKLPINPNGKIDRKALLDL